jgi:hypothetical protein
MNIRMFVRNVSLIATMFFLHTPSHAGPFGDDLSRCVVTSTDADDRATLIKWMVAAMAMHPDVENFVSIQQGKLDDLNEDVAKLFVNTITKKCRKKARDALKYEGPETIANSFEIFGQVAATDLMGHPQVAAGIAKMEDHIDQKALQKFVDSAQK